MKKTKKKKKTFATNSIRSMRFNTSSGIIMIIFIIMIGRIIKPQALMITSTKGTFSVVEETGS